MDRFLLGRTAAIVQLMRPGATASANVVEAFEEECEDDRRVAIVTVAVYEFFVRGTRFIGKTEGTRGAFSVGDAVAIQYDSRDPSINPKASDTNSATSPRKPKPSVLT